MDDVSFDLIAHKVILKEADQSIIKELCNKHFGAQKKYVMPNVDINDFTDLCTREWRGGPRSYERCTLLAKVSINFDHNGY